MPLFQVTGKTLTPYEQRDFPSERYEEHLEEMLLNSGRVLNVCWVGRQASTSFGTYPDLIALKRDGTLQV